jgi:flagellar hook-associated protein 2
MRTAQTVTAGEFTVNGSRIAIATTDTMKDVFDRISTATGGAVTAAYDPVSDGVNLTGTGPITLGSSADTSNFLSALKLFQDGSSAVSSAGTLGASKLTAPLASSGLKSAITGVDGSGNGKFTINGTEVAYNVNTDSLQSVMTRINSSAAGVTASYDSSSDSFTLTNKTTGNVSMFATETGNGFLSATGMIGGTSSFASGENAVFSVDGGGSITSLSNTLDASVHGITGLSLTVDGTGTQTIGVSADSTAASAKISTMLTKYNAVQAAIDKYTKVTVNGTKVTSGLLSGNTSVDSMSSQLRSIMFQAGSGLTGDVKRLSDLGIDFSSTDSTLAIRNQTTLSTKLSSSSVDVGAFFCGYDVWAGKTFE